MQKDKDRKYFTQRQEDSAEVKDIFREKARNPFFTHCMFVPVSHTRRAEDNDTCLSKQNELFDGGRSLKVKHTHIRFRADDSIHFLLFLLAVEKVKSCSLFVFQQQLSFPLVFLSKRYNVNVGVVQT